VVKRIERVRLYPTRWQSERLRFMLDVTRELYNALLQERRDAYRLRGISIATKQQYAEITALRKPIHAIDGRLAAVYRECEDAVLHRLDLAMQAFFRRCKRGELPGFPRFKPAGRWKQLSFPHGDRALRFDLYQRRLTVPGIGNVRLRKGRAVPAFGRAWIVEKNRRWYACFEHDVAPVQGPIDLRRIVGLDRGIHVLAATSEAVLHDNPAHAERNRRCIARHQRALESVTQRDAVGRMRNRRDPARIGAALRLARAKEREANRRRDTLYKLASTIVASAGVIALEVLNLRGMTRSAKGTPEVPGRNVAAKAGLNRRMLDASFGLLRQMIVSKAERAGKMVVEVDARFSSQTCSIADGWRGKVVGEGALRALAVVSRPMPMSMRRW
jgi:putative transposase